jgi:hypothetical protein
MRRGRLASVQQRVNNLSARLEQLLISRFFEPSKGACAQRAHPVLLCQIRQIVSKHLYVRFQAASDMFCGLLALVCNRHHLRADARLQLTMLFGAGT